MCPGGIVTTRAAGHARPMIRGRRFAFVAMLAIALATSVAVPAAGAHPVPTKPIKVVTVHSGKHTYVLKVWAKQKSRHCAPHAYGKVKQFLKTHKCGGVTRYLVTTKVNGRGVGFAQSATSIGGTKKDPYRGAGEFVKLVRKNGTGNFKSLFASGYHTPKGPQAVPDPDAFNVESQDTGVTIVDAWYLHGSTPTNAKPLVRMAKRIYLQWFV